ncbi:hypothetical protein BDZ94DRAFT_1177253 [Collybia nuda]|uniref:Uncharacterized protein n=1 Tax=Collybia nuda TaxID=64659 RepID=A0A9P5XU72_9AGAR|nr:hypothetical protein BDZ94DRAFT_1177253 [Collybia nuda]
MTPARSSNTIPRELGCNRVTAKAKELQSTSFRALFEIPWLRACRSYGGSYTYTQFMGATASFSFNGTSITIKCATLVDYRNYSVIIDGTSHEGDAFTYFSGQPGAPLFRKSSLRQGPHTVTLLNAGNSRLDIDSITWSSDIGTLEDGEFHKDEHSDDDMIGAFEYYPKEAWSSQYDLSNFLMNTGHTTSNSGASVIYTFSVSDIVSLYGSTGPLNSPYTVQLDSWPNKTFQGNRPTYKTQSLLYYADNLGPGDHTLTITNEADSNLQIDYATFHKFTSSPSRCVNIFLIYTKHFIPVSKQNHVCNT